MRRIYLLLGLLLGAAVQCGGLQDPGACHNVLGDDPAPCPFCGEPCRYTPALDPAGLGPCGIGALPEEPWVGSSSSSGGDHEHHDETSSTGSFPDRAT